MLRQLCSFCKKSQREALYSALLLAANPFSIQQIPVDDLSSTQTTWLVLDPWWLHLGGVQHLCRPPDGFRWLLSSLPVPSPSLPWVSATQVDTALWICVKYVKRNTKRTSDETSYGAHHHHSISWHVSPVLVLWLNSQSPSELGRWNSTTLLSGTTWTFWQREDATASPLPYVPVPALCSIISRDLLQFVSQCCRDVPRAIPSEQPVGFYSSKAKFCSQHANTLADALQSLWLISPRFGSLFILIYPRITATLAACLSLHPLNPHHHDHYQKGSFSKCVLGWNNLACFLLGSLRKHNLYDCILHMPVYLLKNH